MASLGKRIKSDYLITNRRKDEDARAIMTKTAKSYSQLKQKSQFEESTTAKINHNHFLHRYKRLQEQEVVKLEERREKLRVLLEEDEQKHRKALLENEESNETRIIMMRSRMTKLREEREKDRQKIVEQKLEQQWRQNCDELRSLESKILVKKVDAGRAIQIKEREARKELEKKEKEHYEKLWEQGRKKKMEREIHDHNVRQQLNHETLLVLKDQLRAFKEQADLQKALKEEEARLMRYDTEMKILEDRRNKERKELEKKAICLDLEYFNKLTIQERQKDIQKGIESDIKLLNEVARLEAEQKIQNAKRRVELKKEMNMYRKHLAEQKAKEIEREKEVEKLYAAEQERIWTIRTEKWRREQAARDKLMKEVLAGRQEQLQEALERNKQAQEECRLQKIEIEKKVELFKDQEHHEREKVLGIRQKYSKELEEQIDDIENRKRVEKRAQILEFEKEKRDYIEFEKRSLEGLAKAREQLEVAL